jgi:hypothetical protein
MNLHVFGDLQGARRGSQRRPAVDGWPRAARLTAAGGQNASQPEFRGSKRIAHVSTESPLYALDLPSSFAADMSRTAILIIFGSLLACTAVGVSAQESPEIEESPEMNIPETLLPEEPILLPEFTSPIFPETVPEVPVAGGEVDAQSTSGAMSTTASIAAAVAGAMAVAFL